MLYICTRNQQMNGALVQLVRIRACHARGQGFESPTHRKSRQTATFVFLHLRRKQLYRSKEKQSRPHKGRLCLFSSPTIRTPLAYKSSHQDL